MIEITPKQKRIAAVVVLLVLLGLLAYCTKAEATGNHGHDITVNNYIDHDHDNNEQDTNGCMCVTGGVSDSDLSKGMAMAMSSGGHELDYVTTDNQFSFVYTQQVDDDEEGAYSFKYGRRWDQLGKALLHVTWVPEQGNDLGNWVSVGTTIRW